MNTLKDVGNLLKTIRPIFSEGEIDALGHVFETFAMRLMVELQAGKISEAEYEAFEVLYDKILYFMEGKELQ